MEVLVGAASSVSGENPLSSSQVATHFTVYSHSREKEQALWYLSL